MNYKEIMDIPLFSNISEENLRKLLKCVNAYEKTYFANEFIEINELIGIVLQGRVAMQSENYDGNVSTLTDLSAGDLFGETFACAGEENKVVMFQALSDTKILALNYSKVFNTCTVVCPFHHRLVENMVKEIARKNYMLMKRQEIISQRTLRAKILTYLYQLPRENDAVYIPISRNEMSYYLAADRSALSRELSKMQADGVINFINKNTVKII